MPATLVVINHLSARAAPPENIFQRQVRNKRSVASACLEPKRAERYSYVLANRPLGRTALNARAIAKTKRSKSRFAQPQTCPDGPGNELTCRLSLPARFRPQGRPCPKAWARQHASGCGQCAPLSWEQQVSNLHSQAEPRAAATVGPQWGMRTGALGILLGLLPTNISWAQDQTGLQEKFKDKKSATQTYAYTPIVSYLRDLSIPRGKTEILCELICFQIIFSKVAF